jgi:hypothetical protein
VGSQPPQHGQEDTAAPAAAHGTGGYRGLSMGGAIRVPFRAPTRTVRGNDKIPLGSFHTGDAAVRASDGWAAATPRCVLDVSAGYERGSARVPR